MNPYENWERKHVDSLVDIIPIFERDKPTICGGDTETTGLHIIKDKAFLIVFGWLVGDSGRVITFYPTPENMKHFFSLAKQCKLFFFHNVKYDLHMMKNIGYEYDGNNLCDTQFLGRVSFEAVPLREGGDSLKLKDIGVKYIHPDAAKSESMVKEELNKLNHERIKVLSAALKQFPLENEFTASGGQKYWGKGAIEKFLKDPTQDVEDLPEGVRDVWMDWQEEYPEPTYEDVDRDLMIQYAGEDVITMLEFARKSIPIVTDREQWDIVKREMKAIKPLWRMERAGLKVDREYLLSCRKLMKTYITKQRKRMYAIAGSEINVGQGKSIIKTFFTNWGIQLDSSDDAALKIVLKNYTGEPHRYAELIKELRTLEKWYSTYLNARLDDTSYDGRFYTQISQCSAVSGRVGSNSQQFPKKGIFTEEGNKLLKQAKKAEKEGNKDLEKELKKQAMTYELFNPRKMFIPTDKGKNEGYNSLWYCDLSQVELRVAANYTLLVSGGDTNLCRAYMPFKCKHYKTGEMFDYKTEEGRSRWDEKNGKESAWIIPETGKAWIPTDLHSETTINAYPDVPVNSSQFKELRGKGKMTNFLCLYGGSAKALESSLDVPYEEAVALHNGYKAAFPDLGKYSEAIVRQHGIKGYVQNMYGRRYYLKNARAAYKLGNFCIQGSCADDMKRSIIEVDELLLDYKSRLVLTVHDELQAEIWKGEEFLIPTILEIMGRVSWSLVPILCDAEVTYTNWAEKKEVEMEEIAV